MCVSVCVCVCVCPVSVSSVCVCVCVCVCVFPGGVVVSTLEVVGSNPTRGKKVLCHFSPL